MWGQGVLVLMVKPPNHRSGLAAGTSTGGEWSQRSPNHPNHAFAQMRLSRSSHLLLQRHHMKLNCTSSLLLFTVLRRAGHRNAHVSPCTITWSLLKFNGANTAHPGPQLYVLILYIFKFMCGATTCKNQIYSNNELI